MTDKVFDTCEFLELENNEILSDLYKINKDFEENRKINFEELKIMLNETQEQLYLLENEYDIKYKNQIDNLELLLQQILREIKKCDNCYNNNYENYKFPSYLKFLNEKLKTKKDFYKKNCDNEIYNKDYLKQIINKKELLKNKILDNDKLINNKQIKKDSKSKKKSLIEEKKNIQQNKTKKDDEIYKQIKTKETELHIEIEAIKKDENNVLKKFQEEINEIKEIVNTLSNKMKKKSINSLDYSIKKKEITILNERLNTIENKKENIKNCNQKKIANCKFKFNKYKNREEIKIDINNILINKQIISLEENIENIDNFIPNIKNENIKLFEKIEQFEENSKNIELQIFSNDLEILKKEIIKMEINIEQKTDLAVNKFIIFKNNYINTLDKLNLKKYNLNKKIFFFKNLKMKINL